MLQVRTWINRRDETLDNSYLIDLGTFISEESSVKDGQLGHPPTLDLDLTASNLPKLPRQESPS